MRISSRRRLAGRYSTQVFKKIKTCRSASAQREKRVTCATEITAKLESGEWHRDSIWYSDESRFDSQANRFNPQNERLCVEAGKKKTDDDVQAALVAPMQQRAPGVMLHMTVSSHNGGVVLAPHIVPSKPTITAKYYCDNVLDGDVFPNIRAIAQEGDGSWLWMQDLASVHTANETKAYLKREKVKTLPWTPKGADCSPIDFFVCGSIRAALKATPADSRDAAPKLKATLMQVISKLRNNQEWVAKVANACRSAPKRLRWVIKKEGAQIAGKPWRKGEEDIA